MVQVLILLEFSRVLSSLSHLVESTVVSFSFRHTSSIPRAPTKKLLDSLSEPQAHQKDHSPCSGVQTPSDTNAIQRAWRKERERESESESAVLIMFVQYSILF